MIETMSDAFDGLAIARQRIAEEAEARTGFLDLGGLGLTALPPELFRLRHLRTLNLGAGITREDGGYHKAYEPWDQDAIRNDIEQNVLKPCGNFRTWRTCRSPGCASPS